MLFIKAIDVSVYVSELCKYLPPPSVTFSAAAEVFLFCFFRLHFNYTYTIFMAC